MGEIVTYRNEGAKGVFSQVQLSSGDRILLSMAQTGFRVSKLLFGMIPTQTIWEVPQDRILAKLTDPNDKWKHPLDVALGLVKDCANVEEVKRVLNAL